MNDRFKFRFWYFNKVEEKWKPWYCDLMSVDGTCLPFDNGEGGAYTDWEHEFICEQCTGLKDKNGKLIYEGDWLKTKDGSYCYVVWFDGFWWVKSLPSEAMDLEHAEFYKECEVIGNIRENADLLEVGGK